MSYTFDGVNKIISFDVSTTEFDVRDLYSRWVDWLLTSDNSKYELAMRNVGGDPLPGSKELGLTYFLLNDWKIRPYEEDHTLTINGNIYSEDGTSPYSQVIGNYQVMVINSVSNLVDSTVQQLPEIEYASFDDCVSINVDDGISGTTYPSGTTLSPVNNLSDAKVIAEERGFDTIKLYSALTITTGEDVEGFTIKSDDWKILTIETGVNTTNTVFEKIDLYGELSGTYNILVDCYAEDITNFLGWMRGGSIVAIELAPYVDPDPYTLGSSYFDNVIPMYANISSSLTMNNDVRVSFTNCTDICEIKGLVDGSVINIGLSGGKIIIADTCVGGDIILSGVGEVINNSLLTIDTDGLVNKEYVADAVWDESITAHQTIGSTGNALQSAGSAGDPWTGLLPGSYPEGSAGHIVGVKLLEMFSLLGLDPTKPLTVTSTQRSAGVDIVQTIDSDDTTTTVTRQ